MSNGVLMVGPALDSWGGVATVEKNILSAMESSSWDLSFVSTMEDGSAAHKVARFSRALLEIRKQLAVVDLCHVHMALGMSFRRKFLVCRMAYQKGVPFLLHVHEGDFVSLYDALSAADKERVTWMFAHARCVIVLSEEWKRYFAAKFHLDTIEVLENAVSVSSKAATDRDFKKFLFLGRMCPKKGVDTLLRSSKLLAEHTADFHVYIAGGGEKLESYRSLASDLGLLDSQVSFLGWADEVMKERLFAECGSLVLPSRAEGLPMCVLEAMAHGCVAIATRVGALPELIQHGGNGFLYDYGDLEALAGLMHACMNNQEMAASVGDAGRHTIIERYSLDAYRSRLERLYAKHAANRVGA